MTKTLKPYTPPFTIAIDSNEGHPWTFSGLKCDSKNAQTIDGERHIREIEPNIIWKSLGRYPNSLGDYTIVGLEEVVGIERKSIEDAWGTFLGFDSKGKVPRAEMFEKELENMAYLQSSIVIIEGCLQGCLANPPAYSHKPKDVLAKQFHRKVLALMQDHGVPFLFCNTRRLAEISAYRYLERFDRKQRGIQVAY
jgi:hypothetical protein